MKILFMTCVLACFQSTWGYSNDLHLGIYRSVEGSGRAIEIKQAYNGELLGTYLINGYTSKIRYQNGKGSMTYSSSGGSFVIYKRTESCIDIHWGDYNSDSLCLGAPASDLPLGIYRSVEGSSRAIEIRQAYNGELLGTYLINGYTSKIKYQNGQGSMVYSSNNGVFTIQNRGEGCIGIYWSTGSDSLCLGGATNSLPLGTYRSVEGSGRAIEFRLAYNRELLGTYLINGYTSRVKYQNGRGSMVYSSNHGIFEIQRQDNSCIRIYWANNADTLCLM